jgi:hypothetical protein
MVFSIVEGGEFVATFPHPLTLETVDELEQQLALVVRGLRRSALKVQHAANADAEYASWDAAGAAALDPLSDTQAELDAVTREMDVIHARYPKVKKESDENRAIREELLTPLRARCVEIGQRRYRIAAGVTRPDVESFCNAVPDGFSGIREDEPK